MNMAFKRDKVIIATSGSMNTTAKVVNLVEHLEIFGLIKKRRKKTAKRIPLNKILKGEGIEL